MTDSIFIKGTCLKSELYGKILDAFLAAGWRNVSSNKTTDFDVLQSVGESGDKKLTIQLRPTSASNASSIVTTDLNVMSYRLPEEYTPGVGVASGTFARTTAEAWFPLYIVPATAAVSKETEMTYYMTVNKNRMIISIETPNAISTGPVTHFIGLPNQSLVSEPGSRGVLVASSAYARTSANVHVSNAAGELASEPVSSLRPVYCQLSPKNPNSAGLYAYSEMKYGNASEGYRGILDSIFALPATGVSTGSIIEDGSKEYRVVVNGVASSNSFPSSALAYRIL